MVQLTFKIETLYISVMLTRFATALSEHSGRLLSDINASDELPLFSREKSIQFSVSFPAIGNSFAQTKRCSPEYGHVMSFYLKTRTEALTFSSSVRFLRLETLSLKHKHFCSNMDMLCHFT